MKRLFISTTLLFLIAVPLTAGEVTSHNVTTSDGVRIYYETEGEGIPIIMIAGGPGGSPSFYRGTHQLWLPYGKLVYVHNRGRGKSEILDSIPNAYSPEKDVLDIDAVRKDLGVDKIIVYGHSYGSMVALLYAATHPENTMALLTTGALSGEKDFQEHNIDGVKYFMRRHYPDAWDTISTLHANGFLTSDAVYENVFPDLLEMYYYHPENNEKIVPFWSMFSDSTSVGFNYDVYTTIVGDDPEWTVNGTLKGVETVALLSVVDCPALIMTGRYDRVCPPAAQTEIVKALPDAELVIFDKSGHRPFIEEPVKFFEITGEFLRKVTRGE
ncbi:MAG: alpha/beta fold hydrolase [candidate division Zixibacteria bacterium]|nr:alpha/beta fold hydrolase [candidate division Zixibacteria bacterium]